MKQLFFILLILFSGTFLFAGTPFSSTMPDSATSLSTVKDSYKLSGKHLAALAEKIRYKETPQEDMYLYILRPQIKSETALPAIVYFTGGGWVNGDVYGQIPNPAWFRDHGIIGIEADYRVKSRHGTSPIECIQDAKSAIRYVREHAGKLGIDPNKIIAAGGSAGGHLAACTFLDGGDTPGENLEISSKPNALVLHNPVLGEGFGKEFFDAHPEFSPILHVKKGWPPTILSNGTKDQTTPIEVAEKFTRLMKEAGNVCELISVKDADHSCDWPVNNPNFLPTMQRMTDFLKEQNMMNENYSVPGLNYFVDGQSGNDDNPGTLEKPFKTIEQINSLQLQEGNSVLFAGSQSFPGTLKLKGISGSNEQPIVIGSFGNGRATINGANANSMLVDSCSWLQVKNLIFTGNGRLNGNTGSGLELRRTQNCSVDSIEASGFLWSGIKAVGGKNIRITNVYAHDNGFSGINVESDGQDSGGLEGSGAKTFRNLYIANCVAENNPGCPAVKDNHSGNGILIGGVTNGTIEYCEAMNNGWDMPREGNGPVGIWAYQCDSITIQYCYAHDNKTSEKGKDGGGFDFDGGMTNSVMQFNFAANNEGAGYGLFQYYGASVWKNNIVRNNISYNDGRKNGQAGFLMWIDQNLKDGISNCQIENNVVVNKYGHAVSFEPGNYPGFNFTNNIFLTTEKSVTFVNGEYSGATFSGNQAWAANREVPLAFPEDKQAILIDPKISIPNDDEELPKNLMEVKDMKFFKRK